MTSPAPVADEVLSWLYRSLGHYRNPDRTYSDIARVLSYYQSSLSPCTENYIYEQGNSALLLKLKGTLPVSFLGNPYKLPISIWIPQSYPHESPMLFFSPTRSLVVRPSQHVSVEGRVYHPYLAQWPNHSGRSNLLDCLSILQDVFGKEPPLVARQSQESGMAEANNHRYSSPSHSAQSRPEARGSAAVPPPPPPKPPEARASSSTPMSSGRAIPATMTAPPLPPKPGTGIPAIRGSAAFPQADIPVRQPQTFPNSAGPDLVAWRHPTGQRPLSGSHIPTSPHSLHPSMSGSHALGDLSGPPAGAFQSFTPPASVQSTPLQGPRPEPGAQIPDNRGTLRPRQPIQDLLSMPSEMASPSGGSMPSNTAAPPIPPNPEKDALLAAISATLRGQLQQSVAQSMAAIPALEAQQRALQQAMHDMQQETYQLDGLNKMLTENEKILHDSMIESDRVVSGIKDKEPPPVDDILVAPTLVGEQLYKLVADERSIGEVLFALTKAMDKGRISSDVFIRQTRSLAREQFLQKALIKKIARGMSLVA